MGGLTEAGGQPWHDLAAATFTQAVAEMRRLAVAGVLLLVGGQGLAMVALTEVTASLGAILAATIPLWVVLLSGLIGTPVSVASQVRLM